MYYHSTDWGFDVNYKLKKAHSKNTLTSLKLPRLLSFSYSYYELNERYVTLPESVYLVIVDDLSDTIKRIGYFGIKNVSDLLQKISNDFGDVKTCQCHFIEQIFPCDGCFTGVIFSNGLGDLVCETINGTVDNRELTSGSSHEYARSRIIYNEFELSVCDNYSRWANILPYLNICLNNKGYYEFAFGMVGKSKGIFFSYYSKEGIYQNIFPCVVPFDHQYLNCRCVENAYLKYICSK